MQRRQKHKLQLAIGLKLSTKNATTLFLSNKGTGFSTTNLTHTHTHTHELFLLYVRLTGQDMCSLTVTSLRHQVHKSDISKNFRQMAWSNPTDSNVSLQSPKSTKPMTSVILSCTRAIWHNCLSSLGYTRFECRPLTETKSLSHKPT
jgi:hypothetical protein